MKQTEIKLEVKYKEELLKYLIDNIKNKSKNNIKTLLKNGNIYVNNKSISQYNYNLNIKDVINIKLVNVDLNINVLYEDKYLIIVDKPSGLLTVSTDKEKNNTLYHKVSSYLKQRENKKVFIVNRIDKDTSGIVVFAKDMKTKTIFQNNWDRLVKNKIYLAIVLGVTDEKGIIKSRLTENKEHYVYSSNTGKLAITKYERLKNNNRYSLLKVFIETGRKNQIRVHMKDINHPIIGDEKYGVKDKKIKRLALHSYGIEFIHPITKDNIKVISKIPTLFNNIFNV